MKSLTDSQLAGVTGGVAPLCNREQFDWMARHMVPDGSRQPGVERHVVAHDAQQCGFPLPAAR
jgi:hypothetical protein